MRIRVAMVGLIALGTASVAEAKCESLIRSGARQSGAQLIRTYKRVVACDKNEAQDAYSNFMQQAGGEGTERLTELALVAINAQIWNPVWEMIGKILR